MKSKKYVNMDQFLIQDWQKKHKQYCLIKKMIIFQWRISCPNSIMSKVQVRAISGYAVEGQTHDASRTRKKIMYYNAASSLTVLKVALFALSWGAMCLTLDSVNW